VPTGLANQRSRAPCDSLGLPFAGKWTPNTLSVEDCLFDSIAVAEGLIRVQVVVLGQGDFENIHVNFTKLCCIGMKFFASVEISSVQLFGVQIFYIYLSDYTIPAIATTFTSV